MKECFGKKDPRYLLPYYTEGKHYFFDYGLEMETVNIGIRFLYW